MADRKITSEAEANVKDALTILKSIASDDNADADARIKACMASANIYKMLRSMDNREEDSEEGYLANEDFDAFEDEE